MGDCNDARALIAFGVGLLLLSGLGAAVSWAATIRILRASRRAMCEINELQNAYRSHPVELRETHPQPQDSIPRA